MIDFRAQLRLLRQLLLTLPTEFDDGLTSDDILNNFLWCAPKVDTATLAGRANFLLKCLHPDKSLTPVYLLIQKANRLVTFISLMKWTLTTPFRRQVYDHCSWEGLHCLLRIILRYPRCTLIAPDGFPAAQGRLRYPQLELPYSYGT